MLSTVLYVIALLAITFFGILITGFSLSFWFGNISHGYWAFVSLSEISKIPISAFKGAWKILFVFAIPFVLFGAIPVGILLKRIPQSLLYLLTLIAILWLAIGGYIWKRGLKSYTSGGG